MNRRHFLANATAAIGGAPAAAQTPAATNRGKLAETTHVREDRASIRKHARPDGGKSLIASLLLHGAAVVFAAICVVQTPAGPNAAREDDEPWGSLVADSPSPFIGDATADEPAIALPPEAQPDAPPETPPSFTHALQVPPVPSEMLATAAPSSPPVIEPRDTSGKKSPRKTLETANTNRGGKVAASSGATGREAGAGNGNYSPARYAHCPAPAFPAEARKAGIHGTVLLLIEVDEHGRPLDVAIRRSSGHPVLDSAALRAVRSWRFEPARISGKPVGARVVIPVRFALS